MFFIHRVRQAEPRAARSWGAVNQQSTNRQNLVLAAADIEEPVTFEEEGGTSSRLHPLQRPKFAELLAPASCCPP